MFWHMQMHPGGTPGQLWKEREILEKYSFIGLHGLTENWKNKRAFVFIRDFLNAMRVNDIVAVRKGNKLIALTQVIGTAYDIRKDRSLCMVEKEDDLVSWITYRRPVKILDIIHEEMKVGLKPPRLQDTLTKCTADAPISQIITAWYEKVQDSLKAKGKEIVLV
ncbi:hypothetical protein [Helicobacter suis]|uniref:hypothetical protein n=1 Tax=Helicobacter suis TaxID=104628 RepID=UPI0001F7A544|nr:hypothetical protein [Helicobacter suis]EFX42797.1 hypothetical protein HSUHS1_0915 [Helicobacter suis HS1]BDR28121.1 hypothetical protein HSHS1_08820 [Helicobacter suis HS1]